MIVNIIKNLKAWIYDKDGVGVTSTDLGSGKRGLDTTATLTSNSVKIEDATVSANKISVLGDGSIKVVTLASTPTGRTVVTREARGSVSGSSSSLTTYVIPNGVTIYIQYFEGGAQGATYDSRVAIYYAGAGSLNGTEVILGNGYCADSNYQKALDVSYLGDGTAAIIMQRTRLDGTAKEMYAKWIGYY